MEASIVSTTQGKHRASSVLPDDNTLLDVQEQPAMKKRAVEELQQGASADVDASEEKHQSAFTVVTYKKTRPAGIPVVIQPTQPSCSFWRLNPNLLASAVVTTAQEKVLTHHFSKDGSLVVTVSSVNAANRLLAVTELVGMAVRAHLPRSYSATFGKIYDVPLEYADEELLSYLREQGVISVKRQVSYVPDENGVVVERRRNTVLLEFPNGSALPKRIFLGFCSYPVEEYLGTATQCFKCQRHGHIAKNCKGPLRCKICAGAHPHKDCTSRAHPRCANCDGPHPATFGACPKKKAATLARALEQLQGKAPKQREPPPNLELVCALPDLPRAPLPSPTKDTTKKSYASTVRESTKKPPPEKQQSMCTPPDSNNAVLSHAAQNALEPTGETDTATLQIDFSKVVIPMLFAALKALLSVIPSSSSFPEVAAIMALEPLLTTRCSPPGAPFTIGKQ